ncbi:protein-tyrosine phosphatase-like protein [Mucidula mucida]|nr:protein-tyrosine phosphatase-like protein [Mucidula mucida]
MAHQQRNSNLVIDRLYLGNLRAATATRGLTDHGITHILSVCSEPIPAEVPQSGIRHRRIEVQDVDYADLLIKLPYAVEFIYHALSTGGTILVHCDTGNSRSAAVVAAYLMCSQRMSSTDALAQIRHARETIWIRPGFQQQLVLYELCEYSPSRQNGIYMSWRVPLERQLAAAGLPIN